MHRHDHDHETTTSHDLTFESPAMVDDAELEGDVLAGLVAQAISVVADLCGRNGVEVRHVLDIGCGPGVGTCDLARRFGSASVVAVDGSAAMLDRAAARADLLGLAPRVDLRQVGLPAGLGTLGRAQIIWASMVLHHVGDEVDALRRIRPLLAPGGLLAILERADLTRVMPDDEELGRPGVWDRLDAASAAWFTDMRAGLPGATLSANYPAMVAEAGLDLVVDQVLTVELDAPLDAPARRFARQHLLRTQAQLGHHADAADLAALDALIDEHEGVLGRSDVRLRASRQLLVARVSGSVPPDGGDRLPFRRR
jgi:SAM-dependent methyltransferase